MQTGPALAALPTCFPSVVLPFRVTKQKLRHHHMKEKCWQLVPSTPSRCTCSHLSGSVSFTNRRVTQVAHHFAITDVSVMAVFQYPFFGLSISSTQEHQLYDLHEAGRFFHTTTRSAKRCNLENILSVEAPSQKRSSGPLTLSSATLALA